MHETLERVAAANGKERFNSLLKNERYTGVYIWGKVRTPGGMPIIIERQIFDEVQRMMKTSKAIKGRKGPNAEYMLTGKLFCGHCKAPMVGISGTGRSGQVYNYYACTNARAKKCDKKNVTREWAEQTIAAAVIMFYRTTLSNGSLTTRLSITKSGKSGAVLMSLRTD